MLNLFFQDEYGNVTTVVNQIEFTEFIRNLELDFVSRIVGTLVSFRFSFSPILPYIFPDAKVDSVAIASKADI